MSALCQRMASLFIVTLLIVGSVTVLPGCQKKTGPQKAGERVGKNIEQTGKNMQRAADQAQRK